MPGREASVNGSMKGRQARRTRQAPDTVRTAGPGTAVVPAGAKAQAETKALAGAIEIISSFVSNFDPGRYSADDTATLVSWFCRAERLCGAGKTLAAARVAESNRPEQSGHKTAADWLASVTGQPLGQAIDDLKLGAALAHQPDLDTAYRGGRLSRPGATLVAGATEINPARGKDLVTEAENDTWRQLRERCLRARAEGQSAEEAARRAAALHKARRCRTWTDADGSFRLDASLTPEAGATLAASLSAESARHFERARKEGARESRDAYTADALVALVTGRGIIGRPSKAVSPEDGETDAGTERPGPRRSLDPKALVTLRVDLDALRRGTVGTGEVCEIPGVGPVSVDTARGLMGDALFHLVITNGVDVTTICHLGRSIPTALRRAVVDRDRTCVVPGCDVAQGLEMDHWGLSFIDGGPATLENVARLCSHHHYLRTHRGFRLSGGPGRWAWEAPAKPKVPAKRSSAKRKARTSPKICRDQSVVLPANPGRGRFRRSSARGLRRRARDPKRSNDEPVAKRRE
jgi:hypothetical protein